MIIHYLTVAFRNLWKYRMQSIVSIIGLAAGFICFSFCTCQLRILMDWSKDIKDIDRICFIYSDDPEKPENERYRVNYMRSIPEVLEKEMPEIESHVIFTETPFEINKLCEITQSNGEKKYFEEKFVMVNEKFMDFFDVQFVSGSIKDLESTPKAILVTEKTAMKMFGSQDVIGKTFTNIDEQRNTREVYTVRGVIRDFPKRSSLEPFSGVEWNNPISNSVGFYTNYVKIKPETDLNKLNQKLKDHTVRYTNNRNEAGETKVQLKPLREYYDFVSKGEISRKAYLFFTIGFLVLLTAILNYIVFISGRIFTRIRECGIRKVNGSSKQNLFRLFFTEALVIYLIACFAGFLIVEFTLPFFKGMAIFNELEAAYMYRLLAQYTVAGIAVIALLCFLITYRLVRISVIQSINNGLVLRQNNFVRNIFIFVQFVICFLFISGSWFIDRQSKRMESVMTAGLSEDDKARTFIVRTNGNKLEAARPEILRKLEQNPNMETVSRNGMDLFGAWEIGKGYFTWDNITEQEQNADMSFMYADANFVDLLKIAPVNGRLFTQGETDKMVVNASFAKLVNRNPIGMIIGVKQGEMQYYQVVGVIPDISNNQFNFNSAPVLPCMYMHYPDGYISLTCYVKVRPGYEKIFPREMETELRKYVNPASPVNIFSLKEHTSNRIDEEQNLFKMTTVFSLICVIITLLGMYAAVVLATEKRKKEITIRKINGATPKIIIWMFCKNIYLLLGLSACIAFPVVIYLLKKWLNDYAVKIEIGVFPFVCLFLLLAALVTGITIGQIVRIAKTNPAEVIKN